MIAYRPTYPLWSDGSGKLRLIRVPKGTSIKFDKDKQTFDIPPNTRFYKTFFRKVIDKAGQVSHKQDGDAADRGAARHRRYRRRTRSRRPCSAPTLERRRDDGDALDEPVSRRHRFRRPDRGVRHQRDRVPGRHRQPRARARPRWPSSCRTSSTIRSTSVSLQHYAIPGSIRCVQCHRGSPTKDFVLGFFPLQVAQRAAGTGGTYEPVDADELNQLQRFIDYGVITGMAHPPTWCRSSESQAPRKPRTDGELNAQALHDWQLRALPQPARLPQHGQARARDGAQLPARRDRRRRDLRDVASSG